MKTRILALVMAAATAMPLDARAQIIAPPPARPQVDANGVDVQTAHMQYSQSLMSIGPSGIGGLNYSIYFSNLVWRHSFTNLYTAVTGSAPPTESVAIGNDNDEFDDTVPRAGNGSSLDPGSFTYMRKDGTVAMFTHHVAGGCDISGVCTDYYFADYLEYPNGVRLTFHYRDDMGGGLLNTRLQSVTTGLPDILYQRE